MRIRKIEKEVPLSQPVLRQSVTVLCEENPKRFTNNALHTNAERISFTVYGQGNEVVYAMVTSTPGEGDKAMVSIETFAIDTNWPVWVAICATATIFYVLFLKPTSFQLWLPVFVFWGLTIKPIVLPLFRVKSDERKLAAAIEQTLDEIAGSHR